jgi:hypothetical protein
MPLVELDTSTITVAGETITPVQWSSFRTGQRFRVLNAGFAGGYYLVTSTGRTHIDKLKEIPGGIPS